MTPIILTAMFLLGAPADVEKVYVLDLKTSGVDDTHAAQLTPLVAAEVGKRAHFSVLSSADMASAAALASDQAVLGCESDLACLAELTRGIDADLVVAGLLGKVGAETMLSLTLVDAKRATVIGRASGSLGRDDDVGGRVAAIVSELLGDKAAARVRFQMPEGEDLSFAVLDLESAGVSADVAKNLTQVLSSEVKRIEGTSVIGRDDIAALLQLEADKSMLGCSDDTACMAELGDALGVARLISGSVGKIASSYVISLRLISTRRAVVENRVSETFQGSEEQLLPAIRHSVRRLLGLGASVPGTLAVTTPHPDARVLVDGIERGVTPLPPLTDISPGRHELRVILDHHFDYHSDVYVGPGETVSQWVVLERTPDEWYENTWLWVGTGAFVAVGLTAVAATAASIGGFFLWDQYRPHQLSVDASIPTRE